MPTIRELMTTTAVLGPDPADPVVDGRRTSGNELVVWIDDEKRRDLFAGRATNTSTEDTQAAFADGVNVAAFFLTNSSTLSGSCPVSVRTSSDVRSKRPARCRSHNAARWFTT